MITIDKLPIMVEKIKESLEGFPYSLIRVMNVTGKSILIRISLDSKESWTNGYIENSRYILFSIWIEEIHGSQESIIEVTCLIGKRTYNIRNFTVKEDKLETLYKKLEDLFTGLKQCI